jgi:hypothetical protein
LGRSDLSVRLASEPGNDRSQTRLLEPVEEHGMQTDFSTSGSGENPRQFIVRIHLISCSLPNQKVIRSMFFVGVFRLSQLQEICGDARLGFELNTGWVQGFQTVN